MSEMRQFSDEELTAYLDGEAELALARDIDAASAARPELKQRLSELDVDREAIAHTFRRLLEAAPEMAELPELEHAGDTMAAHRPTGRARFGVVSAIAACVALLVVGAAGGHLMTDSRGTGWRDYVAAYQALYVGGTLSHLTPVAEQQLEELSLVGKALGKRFELASLQEVEQLDYKRAQTLGFEGRPLVQLAFMSKVGAPVALCIIRSAQSTEVRSDIRLETIEGMQAAHWGGDGFEYLLIGGTDAELISSAAAYFSNAL